MDKQWRIFVIFHREILDWMYVDDQDFNNINYTFINVSSNPLEAQNVRRYDVIQMNEMAHFHQLGAYYAESEAIYNLWKNKELYSDLDYIGFIHWDKQLKTLDGKTNVTECVSSYISNKQNAHISFETHRFISDYNARIMADDQQPEILVGDGRNCYDYILEDYNTFFKTKHKLSDIYDVAINLCACFMVDVQTFDRMMTWCANAIESRRLEVFDKLHRHRLQGGLLERYYGIFLLLEFAEHLDLSLVHHYQLKFQPRTDS